MPSQPSARWPPLLLALRRATRPDHARVAAFVGFARRPGGWTDYREFLAIHRGWIAALDQRMSEAARRFDVPFSGRRLPLLDRDLFMAAVPHSSTTVCANVPAVASCGQALGYLYVYEGFRLGCRVLARQAQHLGIGIGPVSGSALLNGLGRGTRDAWLRLVQVLARVPPEEHDVVVESARALFQRWEDWLRSPQARVTQLQASSGVYDYT